jgi:malate synthase A
MIPYNNVIDPWSTKFVDDFVRSFRSDHAAVLAARDEMRRDRRGLGAVIEIPTALVAENHAWKIRAVPSDLIDRRVEITGPAVDPKMAITALNSGASGYMVDGEDSLSPTWHNTLKTQSTLTGISRRNLRVDCNGVRHEICRNPAVLHYRPRGFHMFERNWLVDETPAPSSLVDAGLFLWWNARELLERGTGPYLYLPKFETEFEARFWHRALAWVEDVLGIPEFSVRVTVLIETVPGLIRAENILWALRDRITGLNVGRWDYVLSLIRSMHDDSDYVLPDRAQMTMDSPAMAEYARWVVAVAHRRGAHAIGGMAAQVPSRKDPVARQAAVDAVRRDKIREVAAGHDGTWVAHPDLVPVAMDVFYRELDGALEQRWNVPAGGGLNLDTILEPMPGSRTEAGLREAVRSAMVYIDAWLGGNGCVSMNGKMEDAATAEISRALVWQWVARGARLDDGTVVDANKVVGVIRGEAAALAAAGTEPRMDTISLLERSILVPRLHDHILTSAYEALVNKNSR